MLLQVSAPLRLLHGDHDRPRRAAGLVHVDPDLSGADPWHLLEFGFAISMILAMKFNADHGRRHGPNSRCSRR